MNLKTEYVEYAVQATLSLLAISSVYMLDLGDRSTYLFLATFPLLFAYTVYISSDGFNKSSLISLITLGFLPLGNIFAFFSIFLVSVNILVSLLGKGGSIRTFYSSVSLPLLISGVILGAFVFITVTSTPGTMANVENTTAEIVSENIEAMIETTGIFTSTRDAQIKVAESVSAASVTATKRVVVNETQGELERGDKIALNSAFDKAEAEVPSRIGDRLNQTSGQVRPDFGEISADIIGNLFNQQTAVALIPLVALGVYGAHPLIGVMVAFFGLILQGLDRRIEE